MHDRGKSDRPIVPARSPNNAAQAVAEAAEGRGLAKGNAASETRPGLSAGLSVPSALDRVRQVAQQDREVRFISLLHHVTSTVCGRRIGRSAQRRSGGGRGDVAGLRAGSGGEPSDLHARVHRGSVPSEAVSQSVHTEARRAAAAARGRVAGGQDPPAGGGRGAERHLRVGSSRGAVPALPPVRFPDPPAEPDLPVPEHPALHRTRDGRSCRWVMQRWPPAGWWPGLFRWSPTARGCGGRDIGIGSPRPRRARRASCLRVWSSGAPSTSV